MAEKKKKRGRPSNKELIQRGEMVVSQTCKVCQSPVRDEITQCLLRGIAYKNIIKEYGKYFNNPLTPTNLNSHKQHINPEIAATEDRKRALAATTEYDKTTKELYEHRYNEEFDKIKATDALYKKRLTNLFHLQREIETLNQVEEQEGTLTDSEANTRRELIQNLEMAYKGFNQDLLKHIALDADLYVKQVNVQFVKMVQRAFIAFTQRYMDVLVKEIEDPATRERLKEQLGDLLDTEVAPVLDPNNAIETDFEAIENAKSS